MQPINKYELSDDEPGDKQEAEDEDGNMPDKK